MSRAKPAAGAVHNIATLYHNETMGSVRLWL